MKKNLTVQKVGLIAGNSMKNRGYTLIELLIALAIATILALMLIPAFPGFLAHFQQASDVNELTLMLSFARSEATKQRLPLIDNFLPPDECLNAERIGAKNKSQHWCYQLERKRDSKAMRMGKTANITMPDQAFLLTFQSLSDAVIYECHTDLPEPCRVTLTPHHDRIAPVTLAINLTGSIRRQEFKL